MANWDDRYSRGEHATSQPSDLLVRVVKNLKPGRALDIACGAGRHAVYLAQHGWQVTAVDASRIGIKILKERAREHGLTVDSRVADLERGEFQIEREAYDLVCVFYYLQRELFAEVRSGLRPGGTFVAAIHMVDESPGIKPMNPDYLLQQGELQKYFRDWEIEHYYETAVHERGAGEHTRRTAEIIARKR